MTLWLHGLGHFHPENEISNRFLEELDIGTSNQWILERVGIRVRRTALCLDYIRQTHNRDIRAAAEASAYTTAELGARAARMAIGRAGLDARAIGMVISGGCASGTLMRVGEGFGMQMLSLFFFVVGSFWGAHDFGWWKLNFIVRGKAIFLPDIFGWLGAIVVQLAVIACLWIAADKWAKHKSAAQH